MNHGSKQRARGGRAVARALRRGGEFAPWLALWLALATSAACNPINPADDNAAPSAEPAKTVERFYAAIAAGDCQAAKAELSESYRDELRREHIGCVEMLESMRPYPLESIVETKTDGRDGDARMVRTRIKGRQSDVIVRVRADDGQWKIVSM